MEKILMNIEPRATRTAGVAHTPPLGRQTSWHQCLTECQRVGRLLLVNARAETTVQSNWLMATCSHSASEPTCFQKSSASCRPRRRGSQSLVRGRRLEAPRLRGRMA